MGFIFTCYVQHAWLHKHPEPREPLPLTQLVQCIHSLLEDKYKFSEQGEQQNILEKLEVKSRRRTEEELKNILEEVLIG